MISVVFFDSTGSADLKNSKILLRFMMCTYIYLKILFLNEITGEKP